MRKSPIKLFFVGCLGLASGCSSNPSEREIAAAVWAHYRAEPCPGLSISSSLKNIIPKADDKHLIVDVDATYTLVGHTEEVNKLKKTMEENVSRKSEAELERYKKEKPGCLECVSLGLATFQMSLVNIGLLEKMAFKDKVVALYSDQCNRETRASIYRMGDFLINNDIEKGLSQRVNIKIDMVKTQNGWMIDKK
jgi:hypothetical protein